MTHFATKHRLWMLVLVATGSTGCTENSSIEVSDERIDSHYEKYRHHAPITLKANGVPITCRPSPSWEELYPEEQEKEFEHLFLYPVGEVAEIHSTLSEFPIDYVLSRLDAKVGITMGQRYAAPWGGEAKILCPGDQVFENILITTGSPQVERMSEREAFDRAAQEVEEHGLLPVLDHDLAYDTRVR